MLIPLIPKDPDLNDFTCRDGEIEFLIHRNDTDPAVDPAPDLKQWRDSNAIALAADTTPLEQTIRIPLQNGDKPKAELMLSGQISRVDPETADRLTLAIVQKAAECLLDISTDLRRQGRFIFPFRVFRMLQTPDGTLSYPTPQGIALLSDFPPHPEITAASASDESLTLVIRFPVAPHRLSDPPHSGIPIGYSPRTFISYPLYIPDPKEMRGSIGSVRSASGGQATGIRFAFLSKSAIKASVAAPEKYYELAGNERTGYRLSSKATATPDYSVYATIDGYVAPFPRTSLLALGENADPDTDPLDWIADWEIASDPADTAREGYLPASLPYNYRHTSGSTGTTPAAAESWPEGFDKELIDTLADAIGAAGILLTRPMTLASESVSRRHASPKRIRTLRVLGLSPSEDALALLYGSDDGARWTPLRRFDPRATSTLLTPPRLFWRLLLIMGNCRPGGLAIEAT